MVELAQEINDREVATGRQLSSFGELRDDGGRQLDLHQQLHRGGNRIRRRGTADPTGLGMHHDWAFSWPANRRVLYNRASADAEGRPWGRSRAGIAWNGRERIGDANTRCPEFKPLFLVNVERT